ncbi:MAG: glycosyltransferase family 4 protein [Candidatus Omnitrophica bacterium]|nr:glycosyltransferase family 4 protein [Candidatus Omnitrophota bacterium]
MRILFLTTRLPFPPIGGERLRPFYFIKYLSMNHHIILISFVDNKDEIKIAENYTSNSLEIKTVYLPRINSCLECLRGLFMPYPLELSYYSSSEMYRMVQQEIKKKKINLVFCHLIRMAHYLKDINIKKILDISDALSLRYNLSSKYRRDLFKLIEKLEYRRLRVYEPKISSSFDLNIVASSVDKEYFERMGVKNLWCLPNGVDIDENLYNTENKKNRIIFFANMRAYPNQDAIIYFYKEIFPFIKRESQDVKLMVVGAHMPGYIYFLFRKDTSVELYSNVSDVKSYILKATVSIAPMRISVGIQNKILQSMALKIPVVATTIAKGGIEAIPDKEIIIADKPIDFAKKVIDLLRNNKLRDFIAENAFRLVKRNYSWTDITKKLEYRCIELIS